MAWAPEARTAPAPGGGGTTLEVLRALESGPRGLTETEAEARLARYGENVLPGRRPLSWPRRLARGTRDPFTALLLGLGVLSAALAAWGTACVIAVLVAVSCVLRATGEHRADRSTAALRELVAATATVRRRTGRAAVPTTREVPVDQLVPGDVVLLAAGDLVPADLRLLRSTGLTVHEAAVTGESAPAAKSAATGGMCFQGSSVVSGTASAVVVATGPRTLLSGALPLEVPRTRPPGPFDRSVGGIAWTLIRCTLLTAPLVLIAGALLRGRGLETLPFAVAVAVGLTPEMLPVIVTTALARGAALLARDGEVIVRRLPALHDLGAMDVLCVDKTGTLTEDRPVLVRSEDGHGHDDPGVLRWAAVNALWTLHLAEPPVPDPLDEAVLDAGDDDPRYEGVEALPCGPGRPLSTAVVRRPGDSRFALARTHTLVVKGAPEDVLDRCALDPSERERLARRAGALAGEGLRVLAVARAERPAREGPYSPADERDLTFTGFVALGDPPAPTAAAALAALGRHGVTVKVLTGDHPGTAARVCRELGLEPGTPVTGREIDGLDDAALAALAARTTVFARCAPGHKARVVRALRAGGHTTGFLGDGVNDLAALHAADVGVCPRAGVDVAREAADVVLASKDLTTLDRAIVTGRRATANIGTYLRITLSSNSGNVIAMLVAGLALPFLPMLPAQVLAQNLFFDAAQLALAFDRPAPGADARPAVLRPRALLRFVTGFGLLNAAADLATFAVLCTALRSVGEDAFHAGWFTENLLTQALVMLLLRSGRAPGPVRAAVAGLAAAGLLLPVSPLGPALGMSPLPPLYYGLLALVLGLYGAGLAALRARAAHQPPPPKSPPPPPPPSPKPPPPSPQPPPPKSSGL
ncbi:magnesium-translocating P-type ATPase [Streptomyces griseocarneus]|uniref:magnesium-translocating P-type ATPase n=1 Tax=Streptomyces griseocarneus TaxID=51201 RepID=UPI00167D9D4F|nr:magnesium-translocating P-type ATPase [Streptomyces griseocarneus]MBZ6473421.1 magnesium-translocating P-type ATPase [Streptomyces griseocarneus]GHG56978.1 magnesium-translocating P-type ATPase [Streptomyces griseocarneus]